MPQILKLMDGSMLCCNNEECLMANFWVVIWLVLDPVDTWNVWGREQV